MRAKHAASALLALLVAAVKAQQVYTITEWPSMCSAIYTSGTHSITVVQSTASAAVSSTSLSDQAANNGATFVLQINQPATYGSNRQASRFWLMPNGNSTADGTLAAQFYINNGQLRLWTGGYYSTSPGVNTQPFAASKQLNFINTTFTVLAGQLRWYNQAFAVDGYALFYKTPAAAVANAEIIASFASTGENTPASWAPVSLTAQDPQAAMPGSYGNSQTTSVVTGIIASSVSSDPGAYDSVAPVFTFAPTTASSSSNAVVPSSNGAVSTASVAPPVTMSGTAPYSSPSSSATGLPSSLQSLPTVTAPGTPIGPYRPTLVSMATNSVSISSSVLPSSLQSLSTVTAPGTPIGPYRPTLVSMATDSVSISSSVLPSSLQSLTTITAPGTPIGPYRPTLVSMATDRVTTSSSVLSSSLQSLTTVTAPGTPIGPYQPSQLSSAVNGVTTTSSGQGQPMQYSTSVPLSTLSTTSLPASLSSISSVASYGSMPASSTTILQQYPPITTSSALSASSSAVAIVQSTSIASLAAQSFSSTASTSSAAVTSSIPSAQSLAIYQSLTSSTPPSLTSSAPTSTQSYASSTYACPAVNGSTVNDNWGVSYVIGCGEDTTFGDYNSQAVSNDWNECFWKCHNSSTTQGVGKCTAFTYSGGTNGVGAGTCFLKDAGSVAFTGSGSNLVGAIQVAYYAGAASSVSSSVSSGIASSTSVVISSSAPAAYTSISAPSSSSVKTTTVTSAPSSSSISSSTTTSSSSSSSAYLVLASPTPCNFGDPAGTDEDDSYCEIDLPFSMTMYSVTAPQTFASTNGYISMINGSSQYQVNPLPFSGIPNTTVLPLFDDLYIYGSASPAQGIFYQTSSTVVTYEYYLGRADASTAINHFTVAYSVSTPGIFTYTYYNVGNGYNGNTSCVGSQGQNSAGTEVASQYSYQTTAIFPGSVIVCNTLTNSCSRTQ